MSKWDRRMLALVRLVATWSKDPSTCVGAAIVDEKNRVVSIGFNGFPRTVRDTDDKLMDRDEKLRRTIHAEDNALLFAPRPVAGCTLYVTHPPCAHCAAKLIQAGITRVVTTESSAEFADRWGKEMLSARQMYDEADVQFDTLEGGA